MAACDRRGHPFEIRLELHRDGSPFAAVGPGCAYFLDRAAERLARARAEGDGPDPEGLLPAGELFAFRRDQRSRGAGEFLCVVRDAPEWVPEGDPSGRGDWRVVRRAVVEAWDGGGRGVRAVLTSAEITDFVRTVLAEAGRTGLEPMTSRVDRRNLETSRN
ncbi:hypothetical protein [Actinocorallia herbida]|uniref:hypothetical protein n=1 Tax=Actinocorallia herbida TaxID=58109 RepID=UPI001B864D11|nr:hypothetical protein [Actinocorallia herbida]